MPYEGTALTTELQARYGADAGNRILAVGLEGLCSTFELHPHNGGDDQDQTDDILLAKQALSQTELHPR